MQRALPPNPVIFAYLAWRICANWKHNRVIFADLAHLLRTCLELLGKFCLLNRDFVPVDYWPLNQQPFIPGSTGQEISPGHPLKEAE